MQAVGTSVTSVTTMCDKSICPKTAFTIPQGHFPERIRTFVTSVTVSQGSRFTMEYISIRRVTRPLHSLMAVTEVTEVSRETKAAFFMLPVAISLNTFVTRFRDKRCDRSDRSPPATAEPLDGHENKAEPDPRMKASSVSPSWSQVGVDRHAVDWRRRTPNLSCTELVVCPHRLVCPRPGS